jgi:hypothetical protein
LRKGYDWNIPGGHSKFVQENKQKKGKQYIDSKESRHVWMLSSSQTLAEAV